VRWQGGALVRYLTIEARRGGDGALHLAMLWQQRGFQSRAAFALHHPLAAYTGMRLQRGCDAVTGISPSGRALRDVDGDGAIGAVQVAREVAFEQRDAALWARNLRKDAAGGSVGVGSCGEGGGW